MGMTVTTMTITGTGNRLTLVPEDQVHQKVQEKFPSLDQEDHPIGKKHALKIYDQFAINTSCFYPSCAISRNFCFNKNLVKLQN